MAAPRPLPPMGIQPSAHSTTAVNTASLAPPPTRVRTRGCCTGLGQDHVRREVDELAVVLGLVVGPDRLHGGLVLTQHGVAAGPVDAVVLSFGAVPAEPDPQRDPAPGEMVERRHLLGQQDRVVLRDEQDAGAEPDARRHRGRRGERDQRVEAALVVVEAHAADECRRCVLAHREVGVLGEVERVEAELLDRGGQHGRGQVAVGQGGGDAQAHGQDPAGVRAANSARVPPPTAVPSNRAKAACSRRLASSTASRRAARSSDALARVAARGWAAMRAARATVSSSTAPSSHTCRARPRSTSSARADPVRCEQYLRRPLPPHQGGEQDAAGGLGGHAELGERHAQARPGIDEDEIAVREEGEAQPDRDAVHCREERDREVDEAVEQSHETLAGTLDGGPGRDGGHLRQILSGGESRAAAGQHDGTDRLVGVGGLERGGHLLVHGGVEGVAYLGPVEGDDPDAGRGVFDLHAGHGRSAVRRVGRAVPARRRIMVSAAPLMPVEMGQPT